MKVKWDRQYYDNGAVKREAPYVNGRQHEVQKLNYDKGDQTLPSSTN